MGFDNGKALITVSIGLKTLQVIEFKDCFSLLMVDGGKRKSIGEWDKGNCFDARRSALVKLHNKINDLLDI